MSISVLSPVPWGFARRGGSRPSERETGLRWAALLTALGIHAAIVLAIYPLFHRPSRIDAAPLVVQLLEAPTTTEASDPQAEAPATPVKREPAASAPARPSLPLSRSIPDPRPIATDNPPPPIAAAQTPTPTPPPPPVAAPEAPTVTASPPVTSTAIIRPDVAATTVTALAEDSALTVSKPAATNAASAIGATGATADVVTPPRFDAEYLANPAPVFPRDAERDGEEGKVILLVKVGVDGAPLAVQIKTSSGWPRLDQAGLAAVRRWRFVPAKSGDKAVVASVVVPLTFSLEN